MVRLVTGIHGCTQNLLCTIPLLEIILHVFCCQVFEELEEIGKTFQEEVSEEGMPIHGDTGGDISKCPYYASKMGTLLFLVNTSFF